MSPLSRISAAFRRIAAHVSIRSVRGEDARREQIHGGAIAELNARAGAFAKVVEKEALRLKP